MKNGRHTALLVGTLLSRTGDNLVELGFMLYLMDRFPGQLVPSLGFYVVRGAVVLALGRQLGSLFDRYAPRAVLGVAIALQVVSLLAFAAVMQHPDPSMGLFWLCGMGLAVGGFITETGLTYTLLPQLATGHALTRLTGAFHNVNQVSQVVGPALAGVLYATGGVTAIVLADLATFLAEGVGLVLLGAVASPTPQATDAPVLPMWSRLRACHVALPAVVLSVGFAWCNGLSPYSTTFNFFLKTQHELSAAALGWVRTGGAVAGILGALVAPWCVMRLGGPAFVLVAGAVLEVLALAGCAVGRTSLVPLLVCMLISRFGLSVFILASVRLRQALIPNEIAGATNGQINGFLRGMGILNMAGQMLLDGSARSFAILAWLTVAAIGMTAVFAGVSWRQLRGDEALAAA